MRGRVPIAFCAGLAILASASASAQSLSPMRGAVAVHADTASVRLTVGNPGTARMAVAVSVHEADWSAITDARATRTRLRLPPGQSSSFRVAVPMARGPRDFRVCVTTVPAGEARADGMGQVVRGQVCGRYAVRGPAS